VFTEALGKEKASQKENRISRKKKNAITHVPLARTETKTQKAQERKGGL